MLKTQLHFVCLFFVFVNYSNFLFEDYQRCFGLLLRSLLLLVVLGAV